MTRAIALLLAACSGGDRLAAPCGLPCWDGPAEMRHVGQCSDGAVVCDGPVQSCDAQVRPTIEVCDGVDNDCDGLVDNAAVVDIDCRGPGVCSDGQAACSAGLPVCIYPDTREVGQETRCDGLDNDCDGLVDEGILGGACYTGRVGTEATAPCHPGVLRCDDGNFVCVNETTPRREVCNGIDDDCDGMVDDVGKVRAVDVLIGLDFSGSMALRFDAVSAALRGLRPAPGRRWGVVDFTRHAAPPLLVVPMGPVESVHDFAEQLWRIGASYELGVDALSMAIDPTDPLRVGWGEHADRYYIWVTDEGPYWLYRDPPLGPVDRAHVWGLSEIDRWESYAVTHPIDELDLETVLPEPLCP